MTPLVSALNELKEPAALELHQHLQEMLHLGGASALLGWDQSTHMPEAAGPARGEQLAVLARLIHEAATSEKIAKAIEQTRPLRQQLGSGHLVSRWLAVVEKDYRDAILIPPRLAGKLEAHFSRTYLAWAKARKENRFADVAPLLEQTLEFSREVAELRRQPRHAIAFDALIERYDEGFSTTNLNPLFAKLRLGLLEILSELDETPFSNKPLERGPFSEAAQVKLTEELVAKLGYDFKRGRQDKTHHPFMTKIGPGDVRITTRYREDDMTDGLFSSIHEAGHALYEQGIPEALEGSILAGGTSSGVHESQSRFWENLIGRSQAFWRFALPIAQRHFPQLEGVDLHSWCLAINRVERSLVRVDADEVTYNLHVIMRYELEQDLLAGRLTVRDLPEAWRARMKQDLGLTPPTDTLGCLQDVHWYSGLIGGVFQGYTIGNLFAAQLMSGLRADEPNLDQLIERGEFAPIRTWLGRKVHQHGRLLTGPELIESATGGPLKAEPFLDYLRTKYRGLLALAHSQTLTMARASTLQC
jgi:carboxypeptidase Taq